MGKWRVVFSSESARQLEIIYLKHPDLRTDILARLKALEHFPPERWFFIYRSNHLHLFRAETGQMIRLSGKADPETHTVQITRAGLVRKPS